MSIAKSQPRLYYRQIVFVRGSKIKQYGEYIYSYKNYALKSLKSALYRVFKEVPLSAFPNYAHYDPEIEIVYRFYEKELTFDEYEDFKKEQKPYTRQNPFRYYDHFPDKSDEELVRDYVFKR